jgi:hypothetical protein
MINPVLYVRKTPSGELELPLFARIMWLNSEKPGWRITSEKFSVVALEVPEGKDVATRYVATGHVAVVDEQGRKVLSVPASTEIDSPYFAEDLFRAGAELALDILGFHVRNIPAEYWEKVETIERNERKEKRKPEPSQKVRTSKEVPEPVEMPEEIEIPRVKDDIEELFYSALKKDPASLGFSKNDLNDPPDTLLNKYCYKITGLPWSLAQEEEKKAVRECLENLSLS